MKWYEKIMKVINYKVVIIAAVVVFILALMLHLNNKHKAYELDKMYDVYPSEVKELYRYLVDANCDGDLYFNVKLDEDAKKMSELDKNNLIDYMFNYLDKKGILQDSIPLDRFTEANSNLFSEKIDLVSELNTYEYKDHTYTFEGDKVTRKNRECKTDKKYVSHLYGYSSKETSLWLDINVGYLKDDIMYDLDDKELGKYEDNKGDLFKNSPYFRVYYVKDNNEYKLDKVKYISKS